MKLKIYLLLTTLFLVNYSLAGYELTKSSWEADLIVNDEGLYPCKGEKERVYEYGSGSGTYAWTALYLCLNPQNKNSALWIVETHEAFTAAWGNEDENPEVKEFSTKYYEDCKFVVNNNAEEKSPKNTGWLCNKKEVLSKNKILVDEKKLKLINKQDFSSYDNKESDNVKPRVWIKE